MNWKKTEFYHENLNDSVNIFQNSACTFQMSDHPVHIIVFILNKTAHNTCQNDINQHQSASKPNEMNNLSEVSGSHKSLSNPSMCTQHMNKSSNAHDRYYHSKMSRNQCQKEINKHHYFA
jgi:hypothetical protein